MTINDIKENYFLVDATQNLKKQGEESFIDKLEELKKKREVHN